MKWHGHWQFCYWQWWHWQPPLPSISICWCRRAARRLRHRPVVVELATSRCSAVLQVARQRTRSSHLRPSPPPAPPSTTSAAVFSGIERGKAPAQQICKRRLTATWAKWHEQKAKMQMQMIGKNKLRSLNCLLGMKGMLSKPIKGVE